MLFPRQPHSVGLIPNSQLLISARRWIGAARLLYCFDFEQVEGQEIDTLNMNTSEHRRAPFKVKIKVRSPKHRELIERGR